MEESIIKSIGYQIEALNRNLEDLYNDYNHYSKDLKNINSSEITHLQKLLSEIQDSKSKIEAYDYALKIINYNFNKN